MLLEFAMKFVGRAIWIVGKQQRVAAAIHVGNVDPAVGADEPVAGFGDQHAIFATDDALALVQRELR